MTSVIFRSEASRAAIAEAYDRLLLETPRAEARQVRTRFGATHLLVAGREDAPPLVLLHGGMANSALCIREGHALFDAFRVYAVDVIGQSVKSADIRLRMDNGDYGEWLVDVLDALGLQRAHVYGASLGGFVSRRLAELAPERIDRMVLIVPAGIVNGPALRGITHAGIPLLLYRTLNSRAALQRFIDSMSTTPDATVSDYLALALRHYRLDIALPPLGSPEALGAFRRPTLIIGAADDITCPGAALLERAPELFPHAIVEVLADCKHMPPTDDVFRKKLCGRVSRFLLE